MSKVVEFCKENKKAIIIGASIVCAGAIYGIVRKTKLTNEEKLLISKLRKASPSVNRGVTAVHNLLDSMNGTSYMECHGWSEGITIKDLSTELINYYTEKGYPLDAEVKGLVLFENGR